jgi:hypothetical protein
MYPNHRQVSRRKPLTPDNKKNINNGNKPTNAAG